MNKKVILLIITLLLITGCGKKVKDTDLYGNWEGEVLTHTQFRNSQVVERVYYNLYLYDNKTYHEDVVITTRNISDLSDKGTEITYKIDGLYTITKESGITLKYKDFSCSDKDVKTPPGMLINQKLYFNVSNNVFSLCMDSLCNNLMIKAK
jgi:hypothetical protein